MYTKIDLTEEQKLKKLMRFTEPYKDDKASVMLAFKRVTSEPTDRIALIREIIQCTKMPGTYAVLVHSRVLVDTEAMLYKTDNASNAHRCMMELSAMADIATSSRALLSAIQKGSFWWKLDTMDRLTMKTQPVRGAVEIGRPFEESYMDKAVVGNRWDDTTK